MKKKKAKKRKPNKMKWRRWAWVNKKTGEMLLALGDKTTRKRAYSAKDDNDRVIRVEIREL